MGGEAALTLYLPYLGVSIVPKDQAAAFAAPANFALCGLVALSQICPYLNKSQHIQKRITAAWPGIYSWSMYLFKTRVEGLDPSDVRRQEAADAIAGCWFALALDPDISIAILSSPNTLEISLKLWIEERDTSATPVDGNPPGTGLLCTLLRDANRDPVAYQRILRASGGKVGLVSKLFMTRLRNALKPQVPRIPQFTWYLYLINMLSILEDPPFRDAILSAGGIWYTTTAIVKLASTIDPNSETISPALQPISDGFGYLYNLLESKNGVTWVSQAVEAGLLRAFCMTIPQLCIKQRWQPGLPSVAECIRLTFPIFKDILPRYLLYRSILFKVIPEITKVGGTPRPERVANSEAEDIWNSLVRAAVHRMTVAGSDELYKKTALACCNFAVCHIACISRNKLSLTLIIST